jgi:HTH-type transcriptional regulator, sugar sensing transcriptional regulator
MAGKIHRRFFKKTPFRDLRAAILVSQAQQHLSLMGGSPELATLEPDLQLAAARGVPARIVSVGAAPAVAGQVVAFLGENVSAPTRFLMVIADTAPVLIATFPPDARASAVLMENPIQARLLFAFLNTEYYLARLSNQNPTLVGEMLAQVLDPEDRERFARILRFLDQKAEERDLEKARGRETQIRVSSRCLKSHFVKAWYCLPYQLLCNW